MSVRAEDEAQKTDSRFAQFMTGAYPNPVSRYCVLMDARGGKVLFSINPHSRRAPASTTKMMAAIVLLEHGKLTDTVVAPPGIDKVQSDSLHLAPSEKISLEDLLYGMMLRSANDTPVAGAYYLCGSVPKFVDLMNEEAVNVVGCRDTHFVTPNGLYAEGHYSSAYDLALIARYGINHYPTFNEIVRTQEKQITRSVHTRDDIVKNTAMTFLKDFPGADGVKTGYVSQAGHCFVGSATRNGWRLIAVALDSAKCRSDVMEMLSYGFDNFRPQLVVPKGTNAGSLTVDGLSAPVSVVTADDLDDVVSIKNPPLGVSYTTRVTTNITKATGDITAGEVVGTVKLLANGSLVAETDAISTTADPVAMAWLKPQAAERIAARGGTIILRVVGALVVLAFAVLAGLSLHGRTITKNSRLRRARIEASVRAMD